MKLCSEYTETILKNNKKFIQISGDYRFANIHVLVNIGVNTDPCKKKGISHLCEHIFLETITNLYSSTIIDKNFSCMGYTDYHYTIFKFRLSNTEKHISYLLKLLNKHINGFCIKFKDFEKCKKDVINECMTRKEDIRYSLKVNKFLTENKIDYVPMGRINDIDSLTIEDIQEHYKQYIYNTNFIIFCDSSIPKLSCYNFIKEYNKINNIKDNMCKNIGNNKLLYINSRYDPQLKIYFKQNNKIFSEKEKVIIYMLEIILNYKICDLFDINKGKLSPIFFRKKIIDNNNIFYVLCINRYNEIQTYEVKKLVDYIVNMLITDMDIEKAKYMFNSLIEEIDDINESYTYSNVFHYLIHNELLAITKQQIDILTNMIKHINLKEVCKIHRYIYGSEYKIVINNR